ncbi:protein SODIUM POTASSIUM ROOT DEFECTIVE 2-like [Phragmites australis]|uniref:protein SODIUM POTASSIUM ROOT DEFECTIVE 2-like n=1 Tax=Phragmites australis TaxID=29695 RepID=UPI002D771E5B|nr:protein SODIUM POTASSIUM ROOT DEFECTIVE 2-like [Phragmites australis]
MRAGGILCRSQAATAVCVPGDARSMVVARRADRTIVAEDARVLHDVRYARLGGRGDARSSTSRRLGVPRAAPPPPPLPPSKSHGETRRRGRAPVAVTLPMVTKSPNREAPARELAAAAKRMLPAPTAAPSGDQVLQVVVMKVAIHCQGCAGKVRKHISKMEGVTSFSIDLESKKVTVMGHVSPAGVLESISKVKKAELLV